MKHVIGRYLTRIVLLGVAVLGLVTASLAEEPRFVRIGTGGTAGTYYPIGGLIASIISNPPGSRPCDKGGSCGVPNLIAWSSRRTARSTTSPVSAPASWNWR